MQWATSSIKSCGSTASLDLTRGCLRLGEEEVELRPKAFEVLRYLAVHAGTLVPKQDLYAAVAKHNDLRRLAGAVRPRPAPEARRPRASPDQDRVAPQLPPGCHAAHGRGSTGARSCRLFRATFGQRAARGARVGVPTDRRHPNEGPAASRTEPAHAGRRLSSPHWRGGEHASVAARAGR